MLVFICICYNINFSILFLSFAYKSGDLPKTTQLESNSAEN